MGDPRAQRTLVKSPPELWAEISDVQALARHLGEFGEIRITRLEPETTVAWEGDRARGTVELEPSGWGTRVTLTAEPSLPEPAGEPEPGPEAMAEPEPEPEALAAPEAAAEPEPAAVTEPDAAPAMEAAPEPERRPRWWSRLFRRRRSAEPVAEPEAIVEPEPEPEAIAEPEPEPVAAAEPEPVAAAEPEPVAAAEPEPEPVAAAEPEPEPVAAAEPEPLDRERIEAVLVGVLDDLGAAHHRPFSRG